MVSAGSLDGLVDIAVLLGDGAVHHIVREPLPQLWSGWTSVTVNPDIVDLSLANHADNETLLCVLTPDRVTLLAKATDPLRWDLLRELPLPLTASRPVSSATLSNAEGLRLFVSTEDTLYQSRLTLGVERWTEWEEMSLPQETTGIAVSSLGGLHCEVFASASSMVRHRWQWDDHPWSQWHAFDVGSAGVLGAIAAGNRIDGFQDFFVVMETGEVSNKWYGEDGWSPWERQPSLPRTDQQAPSRAPHSASTRRVFISYQKAQSAAAAKLVTFVEGEGHSCWSMDRSIESGDDWQQEILDGIDWCTDMVVLFGPDSDQSDHVKREVSLAFDEKKRVHCLKLEDLPLGRLRYAMANIQKVDWFDQTVPPSPLLNQLSGR